MSYTLKIKNHVPLMQALVEALSGHAHFSLDGDLSRCADAIERVPGVSHKETACLRPNTLATHHDFVINKNKLFRAATEKRRRRTA